MHFFVFFSLFFVFLRFSLFFFAFLFFSQRTRANNSNLLQKWEFHSDPVCTDPVQRFPIFGPKKKDTKVTFSGQNVVFGVTLRVTLGENPKVTFSHFGATLNFSGFRAFREVRMFTTVNRCAEQVLQNTDLLLNSGTH